MTELACYLARETAQVNQVVRAGKARYSDKERLHIKRIWVVPRRELFVPDVDEGFFVLYSPSLRSLLEIASSGRAGTLLAMTIIR